MSSETPSAPQTDGHAPDGLAHHQEPSTEPTDALPSGEVNVSPDHETRIAELTQRIAELEQEKSDREREDTIAELVRRFQYLTPKLLRAFGDIPAEELEERALLLNAAIHEREKPRTLGSCGLDPYNANDERPATWAGAFRRAREERRKGRDGVTIVSNSRYSGEL